MTGMPAFIARATTGVSGAASNGEIRMRSTFWVMKLSICEVCVFTLPAPSAICSVNCGTAFAAAVSSSLTCCAVGFGVVGLREADDELAVLAAFLDERRRLRRGAAERDDAGAQPERSTAV